MHTQTTPTIKIVHAKCLSVSLATNVTKFYCIHNYKDIEHTQTTQTIKIVHAKVCTTTTHTQN